MSIPDLIAFIIYIATTVVLMSALIVVASGYSKLRKSAQQLSIDKIILFNRLDQIINEKTEKTVEQTDGFMRFMSQSREWAFEYIEGVQDALAEYDKIASTLPVNKELTIETAEKLQYAYKKLMTYLPEEDSKSEKK